MMAWPNITTIAIVVAFGILAILTVWRVLTWALCKIQMPIYLVLQRHLLLPRLFAQRYSINPTRLHVFYASIYWSCLTLFTAYRVNNMAKVAVRSGRIAVINLALLVMTYQPGLFSRVYRLSTRQTRRLHAHLALATCLEAALHTLFHIMGSFQMNAWNWYTVAVCVHLLV